MQRFKRYLSSGEAEFLSTASVALEFLGKIAGLRIHLGAFGELFEHVMEAALRHPHCPSDFIRDAVEFVEDLIGELNGAVQLYRPVDEPRLLRIGGQRRYLAERMRQARAIASGPECARPIAVRTLFCSAIPWIVEDRGDEPEEISAMSHTKSDGADSVESIEGILEKPSAYLVSASS